MGRVFLVGCLVVCGVSSSSAAGYVKVGSWNISDLGQRRQNRHAIAEHIQLADVDVLALQGIHDTTAAGAPYKNDRLDQAFELLNEVDGHAWRYELFRNRNQRRTGRLCGVAWNSQRVKKLGDTFRIPVNNQGNTLWERAPHAAKFACNGSNKSDFVVIPIHLSGESGATAESRRAREAMALAVQFPEIAQHFGDDDLIVLGDTNCENSAEEALRIFRSLDLRDLNSNGSATTSKDAAGKDLASDRIFVPDDQREFRFSRQYILRPTDVMQHTAALSDHFLVVTALRVSDDDDSPTQRTPVAMPPMVTQMTMASKVYYQGVDSDLPKAKFRAQLHALIDNHRTFSYGQLWNALAFTDQDPNKPKNVRLFYTGWSRSREDHGARSNQWNREHVWAKSRGDFDTRPPAGTDLHHIRPTDVSVNRARSSLPFDNGGESFVDRDGRTKNKLARNKSWEPFDEVKGDVARMLFYMAVRYENRPDLEVVENSPNQTRKPEIGRLSVLIKWHKQDPPSKFESTRNQRVFELQRNRNPFIDHPEWVAKIFQ